MHHRAHFTPRIHGLFLASVLLAASQACKPRAFNDSSATSVTPESKRRIEALSAALMPYWPVPKTAAEIQALPSVTSLGVSTSLWQSVLSDVFLDNSTGRSLTLSNPECARSVDSWRVTAARLSLYEVDLPGNVTSWQTLALQRESDLAQRIQLHITVQPWCVSDRLGRSDFVHTLDHAVQLTFDLTWTQLPKQHQAFIDELGSKSRIEKNHAVKAESKVLPYATSLQTISTGQKGRKAVVAAWNTALQSDQLLQRNKIPDAGWMNAKQALTSQRTLRATTQSTFSHPTLQANPGALSSFFAQNISEKNLLRIRAHVTEGLGTAQWFYRWERQAGKLARVGLQTTSAQWDRASSIVTLNTLLAQPQIAVKLGAEQPVSAENRTLLRDVDLETTPMAGDLSVQELISLNEKVIDHDRTSVHTTRCVSCHAIDEAMNFAREGKPVAQRGITPVPLTLNGVSADGRHVLNIRSLRHAETDAARFEEEVQNGRYPQATKQ